MNTKLNLILIIIIGLFLGALVSRNGSLALIAIPFLVFLGVGVMESPGEIQLRAHLAISSYRRDEYVPIKMLLCIENDGPAIPRLQLLEPAQPKMRLVDGALEQRFTLPAKEKVELNYTFQAPRGRYSWQTVRLVASDPFGLFEKTLILPGEAHTLVLPEQFALRRFKFLPRPTIRTAGPYLSRLPGSGIDFWGVREYHLGDSLRSIHWRMSARRPPSFFSKVFEREEMADIGLLLDARAVANHCHGTEDLFEHSIKATASLAKKFLSEGNRVSMLILNDRLVRVFPGYGKRQLVRILDQLAGCTLGEKVTFETLKYLPVRLFPSHSVIVMVSPLTPEDLYPITRLHAEGYQLLLVSPNPIQRNLGKHSANSFDSFAARAASLEREVLLRRIQKTCVHVIDWNVDQPLSPILRPTRFVRK